MKNVTQTKIKKWGNSLGVRLPKELTTANNLSDGALVQIFEDKNYIIIKPLIKASKINLKSFVTQITPENLHKSIDWGGTNGKEIW
ncbi:MAG: AbrB/MazE/SpoVT family DNA-binding domain-containing protein [Candidatus Falkowbacteria bacterium]|nr:AbrB/MazE/SpoVT family DNA-binding domain-containing protein [Candidatus Falkowbacteria bacterium]